MVSHVLHGLPEYSVVHELVQVFLKLIARAGSKLRIELYVSAKPWRLRELQYPVNLCNLQSVSNALLQVAIVNDVSFLIAQCC